MNLKEYQQNTSRTNSNIARVMTDEQKEEYLNLCHMILGIVGETEEIQKEIVKGISDKYAEELADRMWYVSEAANLLGLELEPVYYVCSVKESIGWIAENYKKHLAYGKPFNKSECHCHLNNITYGTKIAFETINYSFEEWLENNINKLKKRFPEKFDRELAIQQNDMT